MLALTIAGSLIIGFTLGVSRVELVLQRKRVERERQREIEQRIRARIAAIGAKRNPFPEVPGPPPALSMPSMGPHPIAVSALLYPVP